MTSRRVRNLSPLVLLPLGVGAVFFIVDCVGDSSLPSPTTDAGSSDVVVPDTGVADVGSADSGDAATPPVVVEVAAGSLHACAVFSDGHVDCWGDNTYGELGASIAQNGACNGGGVTYGCRVDPVRVGGITNAKHVAVGASFTCVVDGQGAVWCFGLNNVAQLGHPIGQGDAQCVGPDSQARACSATPIQVANAASVVQIALGSSHACVRTQANAVACWGSNAQGELGTGSSIASSPTLVTPIGLPGPISDVSAGLNYDTCVTTVTGGQVWCWGFDDWAQLGSQPSNGGGSGCISYCSATPQRSKTVDGGTFDNYSRLWLAHAYTCAQASGGGAVQCWGIPYAYKITPGLGVPNGTVVNELIPAEAGTTSFDTRWEAACTRDGNGARSCWGNNTEGAIGDGTFTSSGTPKAFATPKWTQLASGASFYVGLDTKGSVYAWGSNAAGQLGHAQAGDTTCGTTFCNQAPVEVKPLP
ncbi:hypothetical protein BH09MYX1_BH09MYX1_45370 [soil metagenome]